MPAKTRHNRRLESMLTRTETAMKQSAWFEAERLALKALEAAREACDFDLMARACTPLQESRRERMQMALDTSGKTRVLEAIEAEPKIHPGLVMVQPPAVGADGRRLRIAALHEEIPLLVVIREPQTRLGLCPIVAVGRITVRAYLEAPKNAKTPSAKWMVSALERLGEAALDSMVERDDPVANVDALLARLDTVPDHDGLHEALAHACRMAAG
ncbi:MAG: hypothetical protein MK085_08760 [Phycisphaerales bacterium]|nr:hypothetical protein [Phycisphaerales bacterium]